MKVIRLYLTFYLILLTTSSCTAQTEKYFKDYTFESIQVQADSIHHFALKALSENTDSRRKWERKFFYAFPNSFPIMDSIFGIKKKPGPLYHTKIPRKVQSYVSRNSHIGFFSQLTSIPTHKYYDKYVNICINGYWQADKIRAAFGFGLHLLNNTKPACEALSKKSDSEIESVFRFIFDGPHPDNEENRHFFRTLLPVVKAKNERLSKLLIIVFDELTRENHKH